MNSKNPVIAAFIVLGLALLAAPRPGFPAGGGAPPTGTASPVPVCPDSTQSQHGARYARGVLWKIERGDLAPSFLFGTIHSSDPRVLNLPAPVREAFDTSDSFTMETFFNGSGLIAMAEAMFFDGGGSLERVVGKETYARAVQAFTKRGLPTRDLDKKKPWAVIMTLGAPQSNSLMFLDLMLQKNAVLAGKPNYKLEAMDEQIAVFDRMPLENQATLLQETLQQDEHLATQMESMIQAYLARDLACIMTIVHRDDSDNSAAYSSMLIRLLTDRNRKMADRLQSTLQEGKAFIAVGAGHLPGDQGLLILLEQKGYVLTSVY
jgi:hypothetical protein